MAVGDREWADGLLSDELGTRWDNDVYGHAIFDVAYYSENIGYDLRLAAQEAFDTYMDEWYGLDFDDWFDWDDYREWYDAQ